MAIKNPLSLAAALLALGACQTSPPSASQQETRSAGATLSANGGLVAVTSGGEFGMTVENAREAIESRGLRIMAEVDHTANAKGIADLRPTFLFIFGNPKVGTQFMQRNQSAGIDLPMKLLVWEDQNGAVQVGYNDPTWLAERHGLTGIDPLLTKVGGVLAGVAEDATK